MKQYNNFYYYNALDGHEGNDLTISLFEKYSDVIRLHKDIQTSVVDLIYLGATDSLSKGLVTGRISADEGKKQIETIVKEYNISALLSQLEECAPRDILHQTTIGGSANLALTNLRTAADGVEIW